MLRDDVLHHVRGLGGLVNRDAVVCRLVVGQHRSGLIGHTGVAREFECFLDHHMGLRKRLIEVVCLELALKADVVAQLGVDHIVALERIV